MDKFVSSTQADGGVQSARQRFPIVGIGASAGGLAAFESFFSQMPADSSPGMAIVLVQHLARDHKSILAELIRRYTSMQVFDVVDGLSVEANCAYIIPPNRDMSLVGGKLQLFEPASSRGLRLPIDFFFRSLAQDQHENAICVILSGTGSDGSLGARAVKGEGGMVMVQAPESAEYDGMCRSAIQTGVVDYVLTPDQMPAQLLAYVSQAFTPSLLSPLENESAPIEGLDKIFQLLRSQTGHDFSQYKRNTILRRVERRMAVHQIQILSEYVRYLQLTKPEVDALFRDLMIGVTSFFRDAEIFVEIQTKAIPELLKAKTESTDIRIWVPGCSTGEEAYSIAMMVREQMDELKLGSKVSIFATDIDRESIEHARAGVYPSSIVADISPERLAHFFDPEDADGTAYRVRKSLRDMLIFSEHSLIKDPPFSKLDLISCRNLLIYMSTDLQKRLMPLFHYALKPGGLLVLGSSESIGDFSHLFSTVDRAAKIFQRKPEDPTARHSVLHRILPPPKSYENGGSTKTGLTGETRLPLQEIAARTVLDHFAPVGALVNERGDILYLLGRTGKYLEPTPGEASLNIFKMARAGLRADLTVALHRSVSMQIVSRHFGLTVQSEESVSHVNLTVIPVPAILEPVPARNLFLVILEEVVNLEPRLRSEPAVDNTDAEPAIGPNLNDYVLRLKQELRDKDEYLQTTVEELETANEELRSAHEEMQSVNEEMQSTNEELETSKEELQSVNEELATVNSELQAKVTDLSRSNDDMKNLLSGTGIGTVFVDLRLRILRFTPSVSSLINLIESDVGRPIDQLRSNLIGYDRFAADINEVLESLVAKELEVGTAKGEWFLLRIRPYRTLENVIEGAVITFTEITLLKQAQDTLRDSENIRRLAIVVRDCRDAVLVQDLTGKILAWNPGAVKLFGWTEAEALNKNVLALMPETTRKEYMDELLERYKADSLQPLLVNKVDKAGTALRISLVASPLINDAGEIYAIATTERALQA
jgi:two-component system CheB/CheR fusion protein